MLTPPPLSTHPAPSPQVHHLSGGVIRSSCVCCRQHAGAQRQAGGGESSNAKGSGLVGRGHQPIALSQKRVPQHLHNPSNLPQNAHHRSYPPPPTHTHTHTPTPHPHRFITFQEESSVAAVFAAGSMQELNGKRVEVKAATPKGSGPVGRGTAHNLLTSLSSHNSLT